MSLIIVVEQKLGRFALDPMQVVGAYEGVVYPTKEGTEDEDDMTLPPAKIIRIDMMGGHTFTVTDEDREVLDKIMEAQNGYSDKWRE